MTTELKNYKFKEIELVDKKIFDSYLAKYPPFTSEFTFTNLFAWRKYKKYAYAMVEKHIIISFKDHDETKFMQPIGDNPAKIIKMILHQDKDAIFVRIDEKTAKLLTEFNVIQTRDMDDYVYNLPELVKLEGTNYAPKRNFIKRAKKYNPVVCKLNEETVKGYLNLQKQWCEMRNCQSDSELFAENEAVIESLTHFKEFNLLGVCVMIDGHIGGFAIGEPLNDDTFVEHFEKGNSNFTGIYQLVLHEFSKAIPEKYKYLNREQDLGIEGLRKAKESYKPEFMVKKYSISNKIQ